MHAHHTQPSQHVHVGYSVLTGALLCGGAAGALRGAACRTSAAAPCAAAVESREVCPEGAPGAPRQVE
jgi:hypothetical protein